MIINDDERKVLSICLGYHLGNNASRNVVIATGDNIAVCDGLVEKGLMRLGVKRAMFAMYAATPEGQRQVVKANYEKSGTRKYQA